MARFLTITRGKWARLRDVSHRRKREFQCVVEHLFNHFTLLIYSYKAAETCGINILAQVILFVLLILMFG
jgi:hypothetical protein